jgi:hypothetical protein
LTVTTTVQTPFKANALERQLHRAVPGVGLAFIDQSLFGLLSRPEVPGSQHRNDFKVDQIVPAVDPGSQQFLVRRIHDLETASTCRIHPTRVVDNVVRQHSSVTLEALANELRVAMLEALNDHEQHEQECTRILAKALTKATDAPPHLHTAHGNESKILSGREETEPKYKLWSAMRAQLQNRFVLESPFVALIAGRSTELVLQPGITRFRFQ